MNERPTSVLHKPDKLISYRQLSAFRLAQFHPVPYVHR